MNRYAIVSIVAMISFVVNETMIVTAQEKLTNQTNSINPDKQKITVTWLEANSTKSESNPMISVSSEDFWKTFGPLVKQSSLNGSIPSSK
jgi:hypothetical protein